MTLRFRLDGHAIDAEAGDTIMQAADRAGYYIPRLCDVEGVRNQGGCRLCNVKINGRMASACTEPARDGAAVESETEEINGYRRDLVIMLFHEGNHLCPICEASGQCELQAMAYRLGLPVPTKMPRLEPCRPVDASHPDIALDTNRCISCGRCIRVSQERDGKGVFGYVGRGIHRRVAVDGACLAATRAEVTDQAIAKQTCPVGCIIRKREGFRVPLGEREFDGHIIGDEIEARRDG